MLLSTFHSWLWDPSVCICVFICGGQRERGKASEGLQGLGPGSRLERANRGREAEAIVGLIL